MFDNSVFAGTVINMEFLNFRIFWPNGQNFEKYDIELFFSKYDQSLISPRTRRHVEREKTFFWNFGFHAICQGMLGMSTVNFANDMWQTSQTKKTRTHTRKKERTMLRGKKALSTACHRTCGWSKVQNACLKTAHESFRKTIFILASSYLRTRTAKSKNDVWRNRANALCSKLMWNYKFPNAFLAPFFLRRTATNQKHIDRSSFLYTEHERTHSEEESRTPTTAFLT